MSRLAFDATLGITGVVEAMHHNISRRPWIFGAAEPGPARGLTGVVYGTVRGVMRLVGSGMDAALRQVEPLLGMKTASMGRQVAVAALNGIVGDHLVATGNPLATRMHLRHGGALVDLEQPPASLPKAAGKLLVLVHGLCMNDRGWQRLGHDHGAALARDLGYTPLYLVYNSGLHVSRNGRRLADLLEDLLERWPVPVQELTILGYSMGGLVARSACHYGAAAGHRWPGTLRAMVFLGTPHHGAALERAGNWVDVLMDLSPYSAPLTGLGKIRSAGITDLRHGSLVDEDWRGRERFGLAPPNRVPVPLPSGAECYALAGLLGGKRGCRKVLGDGLVPLDSALGRHDDPRLALPFPRKRRWVCEGVGHMDLLNQPEVYERIRQWLAVS